MRWGCYGDLPNSLSFLLGWGLPVFRRGPSGWGPEWPWHGLHSWCPQALLPGTGTAALPQGHLPWLDCLCQWVSLSPQMAARYLEISVSLFHHKLFSKVFLYFYQWVLLLYLHHFLPGREKKKEWFNSNSIESKSRLLAFSFLIYLSH